MSHTVTVQISFKDPDAATPAIEAIGGKILGQGTHRLYAGAETGFGFTLPGWQYPLVITAGGQLKFDDYHGVWGNRADIERLEARYAVEVSKKVCDQQGWMYEQQPDGALLVYHPDGGTLTVTGAGQIDATGFTGKSCAAATAPIEAALGLTTDQHVKPEYNQEIQSQGEISHD